MTCRVHVERDEPGALVVAVRGEVDMANADDVGAAVLGHAGAAPRRVVVLLEDARYLDSSGLRMLYDLSERIAARGGSMRVVLPSVSPLRRLLAMTKIDTLLPVHESLESALLPAVLEGAA